MSNREGEERKKGRIHINASEGEMQKRWIRKEMKSDLGQNEATIKYSRNNRRWN